MGVLGWSFGSALGPASANVLGALAESFLALGYFALTAGVFWSLRQRPDLSRRYRLLALIVCIFGVASGGEFFAMADAQEAYKRFAAGAKLGKIVLVNER